VRVLEAEAGEFDGGFPTGSRSSMASPRQVGRIQDPESAVAGDRGGGDVEAFEDVEVFLS
jgi:hypothetical protein